MKNECPNCQSERTTVINEPVEIEKKCSTAFLIVYTILGIITAIGIIILIKGLGKITALEEPSTYHKEINEIIVEYFEYQINLQKAEKTLFTSIIFLSLGIIPSIFLLIWQITGSTYTIKTKVKNMCFDCGKKWTHNKKDEKEKPINP